MTHDVFARCVEPCAREIGDAIVPAYLNALRTARRCRRLARRSTDRQLSEALVDLAEDYDGEAARLRRREHKAPQHQSRSDR